MNKWTWKELAAGLSLRIEQSRYLVSWSSRWIKTVEEDHCGFGADLEQIVLFHKILKILPLWTQNEV